MSLSKVNSSRAAKRKRLDILVLWYRVRHSVRFGRWVHNNRTCHVGVRIVVVQILCAFDDGDVRKSIFRFLFPCWSRFHECYPVFECGVRGTLIMCFDRVRNSNLCDWVNVRETNSMNTNVNMMRMWIPFSVENLWFHSSLESCIQWKSMLPSAFGGTIVVASLVLLIWKKQHHGRIGIVGWCEIVMVRCFTCIWWAWTCSQFGRDHHVATGILICRFALTM